MTDTTQPARPVPTAEPPDGAVRALIHPEPVWDEHWQCLEIGRMGDQTVMVMDFIFTNAIITVTTGNRLFYDDRWCYHDRDSALAAARAWLESGGNEPSGWHRHPESGRRRPDGDSAREYVEP